MSIVTRSLLIAVAALCTTCLTTSVATAQHPGGTPPAAKEAEKKVTWAVAGIGEDLKVMTETALAALQKEQKAAHDKAVAEDEKQKKDAETAKKKFDGKMPKEEVVEVKKAGFATEAEAKKFLDELIKARSKTKKK